MTIRLNITPPDAEWSKLFEHPAGLPLIASPEGVVSGAAIEIFVHNEEQDPCNHLANASAGMAEAIRSTTTRCCRVANGIDASGSWPEDENPAASTRCAACGEHPVTMTAPLRPLERRITEPRRLTQCHARRDRSAIPPVRQLGGAASSEAREPSRT